LYLKDYSTRMCKVASTVVVVVVLVVKTLTVGRVILGEKTTSYTESVILCTTAANAACSTVHCTATTLLPRFSISLYVKLDKFGSYTGKPCFHDTCVHNG
jgi:hypothetical protein